MSVSPVSGLNNMNKSSSRAAMRAKTFLSDIAEGKDWTFERSIPGRSFSISIDKKLRFASVLAALGAIVGGIHTSFLLWDARGIPSSFLPWNENYLRIPWQFAVIPPAILSACGLHVGTLVINDITDRKIGSLTNLAKDYKWSWTPDHQAIAEKLETVIKTAGAYIQSRNRATYFLRNTLWASGLLLLVEGPRQGPLAERVVPALAALGIALAGGAEYHHRIYKETKLEKIREQAHACLRMMEKNQK